MGQDHYKRAVAAESEARFWRDKAADAKARIAELDAVADMLSADCQTQMDRIAELEAALRFYTCYGDCDCLEHEKDRISCGWTARAALGEKNND